MHHRSCSLFAVAHANAQRSCSPLVYTRAAQPFRYCRPHYVCFYELRPPVSSRYFIFCPAAVLLSHTEPTLLPHVCLAFFLLSTVYSYTASKEFLIVYRRHSFYILNYKIMCTAASIFTGSHMRPNGRRLCTPGLHPSVNITLL